MPRRELSKDDLKKYRDYLTVGRLKKFIEKNNLSDDSIVVIQRVEDVYYQKHNWGVYLKESELSHNARKWNEDVDSGKYLDKEKYPLMKEDNLVKISDDDLKEFMDEYHPAWCCVFRKEDNDILFIDLHY